MARPTLPLVLAVLASIGAAPPIGEVEEIRAEEGPEEDPEGRVEWWHKQRAFPASRIPKGALARARDPFRKLPRVGPPLPWAPIGPAPLEAGKGVYATPNMSPSAGRASALVVDPVNPQTLYAGYAIGGVWKSTDGGATFAPILDLASTLAVGAIAIHPTQGTLYVGTGEPAPYIGQAGEGILRSMDGGKTFEKIGGATFDGVAVGRIVIDAAAGAIYAATMFGARGRGQSCNGEYDAPNQGLYRSTDGGATWTSLRAGPIVDVEIDLAATPRRLLISDFDAGAFVSEDAGGSWIAPAGLPTASSSPPAHRIELSLSTSNPNVVYAGMGLGAKAAVYRSTDGGKSFSAIPGAPDYCQTQCHYDNAVSVDPKDEKTVYLGGGICGVWKTSNGTDASPAWANVSLPNQDCQQGAAWLKAYVHPDIHAITFDPKDSNVVYAASDGGIAQTKDGGATWGQRNAGVGTLQIYAMCAAQTDADAVYGGAQDNGIFRKSGASWKSVLPADGGPCAVDAGDPQVVLGSTQYASIFRSKDAFASTPSFVFTTEKGQCDPLDPGCGDRATFIAPLVSDPSTPGTFYVGTHRVWKTDKGGAPGSWTAVSDDLTAGVNSVQCPEGNFGKLDDALTAVAVAPSAPLVLYTGSQSGQIHTTKDGGKTWTRADKAPLPGRWVSSIAVDPTDPNLVWASFSGFGESTPAAPGHVFRSADGGKSWELRDIGTDTPVDTMIAHPVASGLLYAGTDAGVLHTIDGGTTWSPLGDGLPASPVYSLVFHEAAGALLAGTFGRSAWSLKLPVGGINVVPDSLSFEAELGQSPPKQTIRITASDARGGITPVKLVPIIHWLALDRGGAVAAGTKATGVGVSINTASLPEGVHTTTLVLLPTGGTPVEMPVKVTIKAPPPGAAKPPVKTAKDGCGCRVAGDEEGHSSAGFAAIAIAAAIGARRRWRRGSRA